MKSAPRDAATAARLFERHGAMVYRRALRILANPADAQEATQEVFIRALNGVDGFRGASQETTWLYRITTNYCLNLIRDRSRRRELFDQHYAGAVDSPPEGASPTDVLLARRLLAEADPQQAQAAVYVFCDGMSHDEAADLLGVSQRTVGNLLERFRVWAERRVA